jgi:hypothetical protein
MTITVAKFRRRSAHANKGGVAKLLMLKKKCSMDDNHCRRKDGNRFDFYTFAAKLWKKLNV